MSCKQCIHKCVCPLYLKDEDSEKCPHYANKNEFMRIKAFKQQGKRKTIGEIIRRKRKERGWGQKHLAKILGTQLSTVSHWERDVKTPHLLNVCDLADLFECSIDELCGRGV